MVKEPSYKPKSAAPVLDAGMQQRRWRWNQAAAWQGAQLLARSITLGPAVPAAKTHLELQQPALKDQQQRLLLRVGRRERRGQGRCDGLCVGHPLHPHRLQQRGGDLRMDGRQWGGPLW